jgi:lysophospholipase L1-like esterase
VTAAVAGAQSMAAAATTAGLNYVAIGSSFAAGPGIPPVQSGSGAAFCARSGSNYASLVTRDLGANLTDVSCSGATTANVLTTSQGSQPPQISGVTSSTTVVTATIGGNDVDYLGSLSTYTCQDNGGANCGTVDRAAIDRTFGELPGRIQNVVTAVRNVAPQAKVYLVDYFTILPDSGACAGVPLTADQLTYERSIATRLAAATAGAAAATGATLVDLAAISHGHDACSAVPWVETGQPAAGRTAYHPNEAGMRGAAQAVEAALSSAGQLRTVTLRSGIPGKCADVAGSSTADGAAVQLYGCNGTGAQAWTYAPGAGGAVRALGKCLDVSGGGTANYVKVQLWTCTGSGNQRWVTGANSSLINPQSGRCLDDPGSSTADRTRLQIYDCNGTGAQQWTPTAS